MILEINVGIQAVSLTDGAFSIIITTAVHTVNLMSSPAMALQHFSSPPKGIIMLIKKRRKNTFQSMREYNGRQGPLEPRGDKGGCIHPAPPGQSRVTNGHRHYAGWLIKRT